MGVRVQVPPSAPRKKPVTAMVTGFFLARLGAVFPFVFPLGLKSRGPSRGLVSKLDTGKDAVATRSGRRSDSHQRPGGRGSSPVSTGGVLDLHRRPGGRQQLPGVSSAACYISTGRQQPAGRGGVQIGCRKNGTSGRPSGVTRSKWLFFSFWRLCGAVRGPGRPLCTSPYAGRCPVSFGL